MPITSSFVTADEVVATAMSLNEGSDTIDRAYLKQWVYLGLKEIGPNTAWFDEVVLYPVDFSFRKPLDMHSIIDLALYDSAGGELKYTFRGKGTRIHTSDNSVVNEGTYAPAFGSTIDVSEDAYYFHIGSSSVAANVDHAKLKYWKFPVDEHGDLMIPEDDVFPLTLFLRYMWYMRKDDKQGIALSHPIWIMAKKQARAAHNTPSMFEGQEIARTWTSMIQKQRFKQF